MHELPSIIDGWPTTNPTSTPALANSMNPVQLAVCIVNLAETRKTIATR